MNNLSTLELQEVKGDIKINLDNYWKPDFFCGSLRG